ncbi:MAG: spheroidene monooxygenase [Pseudomonadota bacterium]
MQTVTLSLYRFGPWADRLWAFTQMGFARRPLARLPGLRFRKLLGVGTGEGFTPVPDTSRCAILCVWDDAEAARTGLDRPVYRRFARRAQEVCTLTLQTVAARGRWSGRAPFRAEAAPGGPIAALTRATLRPRKALQFWRRVPDISHMVGTNDDILLKVGVGEVPFLHQVTFSIWPDADTMARFARTSGPHAAAIRAVRDGDWFAEELYARFRVAGATGTWHGRPAAEVLA